MDKSVKKTTTENRLHVDRTVFEKFQYLRSVVFYCDLSELHEIIYCQIYRSFNRFEIVNSRRFFLE